MVYEHKLHRNKISSIGYASDNNEWACLHKQHANCGSTSTNTICFCINVAQWLTTLPCSLESDNDNSK